MSQPASDVNSLKQRVSTRSTGWYLQAVTGIDPDYVSVLKAAEEIGLFWSKATLSVCADAAIVSTEPSPPRVTLARTVMAGDMFDDFRGHWMPIAVHSPVEGMIESWPVTRLLLSGVDFVSSVPQVFDYVKRTGVLADANVCMFPYEDEENGHIVFKSQFLKDAKEGEEILWWVPSTQAQERAVRMPPMKVKQRQQFMLETKFRQQHGAHTQSMHEAALRNLGDSGFLETCFDDDESQLHLGKMYQRMQQDQGKLASTTIFMKRLRFFPLSSEEIAVGETPLPQQQVKKNLLSYHHNYHHISYHYLS
jgi:hypothetical protein